MWGNRHIPGTSARLCDRCGVMWGNRHIVPQRRIRFGVVELTRATNPYSAGAGTMPPFLAGRDKDVERFDTLLARLEAGEQGRSLVYSGLRGVGKTVLLLEFEKLAVGRGWDCTGVVEIGATTDFRTSISRMTHRLLRGSQPQACDPRTRHARARRAEGVQRHRARRLPAQHRRGGDQRQRRLAATSRTT